MHARRLNRHRLVRPSHADSERVQCYFSRLATQNVTRRLELGTGRQRPCAFRVSRGARCPSPFAAGVYKSVCRNFMGIRSPGARSRPPARRARVPAARPARPARALVERSHSELTPGRACRAHPPQRWAVRWLSTHPLPHPRLLVALACWQSWLGNAAPTTGLEIPRPVGVFQCLCAPRGIAPAAQTTRLPPTQISSLEHRSLKRHVTLVEGLALRRPVAYNMAWLARSH